MCIAIVNLNGETLPKKTFHNIHKRNGDGLGLVGIVDGRFQVYKTMQNVNRAYSKYLDIRKASKHPILVHARIGTSGTTDEKNLHPFPVSNVAFFIHNGVCDVERTDAKFCDTWHVARALSAFANPERVTEPNTFEEITARAFAGTRSKFAFLRLDGTFHIINEALGHWKGKTWYSNDTYKSAFGYRDFGGVKKWNAPVKKNTYQSAGAYGGATYHWTDGIARTHIEEHARIWCIPERKIKALSKASLGEEILFVTGTHDWYELRKITDEICNEEQAPKTNTSRTTENAGARTGAPVRSYAPF